MTKRGGKYEVANRRSRDSYIILLRKGIWEGVILEGVRVPTAPKKGCSREDLGKKGIPSQEKAQNFFR